MVLKKFNKYFIFNLLFVCLFVLIALAFTFGRVGTHLLNYPFLASDAANISSFASALDHPSSFVNDVFLHDPANFAFYNTIHIPLIRILGKVMGNYGSAFALLILPTTFLHLLGYYLLGNVFFQKRIWSVLFTLTVMVPIQLNVGESWGLLREAVPRFLFQALLPFVLIVVIRWGKDPKTWPWLMGLTGLLVYVHPVSLPAWGLAVLLGLWFLAPKSSIRQKALFLGISVIVFMLVILPFAYNYLSTTEFGESKGENYSHILKIMQQRFNTGFIDLKLGYKDFIKLTVFSHWLNILIWVFILIASLGIYNHYRKGSINHLGLILLAWWFAILFTGVILPIVDQTLTSWLKRMPFEVDLIRSLRYIIPLMLLTLFFLLSEWQTILEKKAKRYEHAWQSAGFLLIGIFLAFGWMLRYEVFKDPAFVQTASCWSSGQITCPLPNEKELIEKVGLLDSIKSQTPEGATILAADISDLAIRYYALRPLVYNYKDGSALIYANHNDLLHWYEQYLEMSAIEKLKTHRKEFIDGLTDFARKYQAHYIVLYESYQPTEYLSANLINIYSNPGYSLHQVHN